MSPGIIHFVAVVIAIALAALICCLVAVIHEKWSGPLARRLRQSRKKSVVSFGFSKHFELLDQSVDLKDPFADNRPSLWKRASKYVKEAGLSAPLLILVVIMEILVVWAAGYRIGLPFKVYVPLSLVPVILNPLWIMARHKRRILAAESQLTHALQVICSAMRAGHSLDGALNSASGTLSGLLAAEFKLVSNALSLGVPMEEALSDLSSRIGSDHVSYVVAAIRLQYRLGGDLTKLLDGVGDRIRQRFEVMNQVHALSAEGRMSGTVLMILPITAFGLMYYLAPEYISLLFEDSMGKKLLWGTVALQIIGVVVIRRICSATA